MAFLLPQSFQKRLIRYALTHIDLLDVDALDLDRFVFGWRSEDTLTLNDISLHKDKLASLLHLPPGLALENASASTLSVSIPADLQHKPIKVRLKGVRIRIVQRPPAQQAQDINDPRISGGYKQEQDASTSLPTPKYLAQSFLEREDPEAKAELAAEMNATDQSTASIDVEDDTSGFGAGIGFGLPAFLTDFLRHVLESILVFLQDVIIDFEGTFDPPPNAQECTPGLAMGFKLCIAEINTSNDVRPYNVSGSEEKHSQSDVGTGRSGPPSRYKQVVIERTSLSLLANQSVFDLWLKGLDKDDLRKDCVSPIHSWNDLTHSKTAGAQVQRDASNESVPSADLASKGAPSQRSAAASEAASGSPQARQPFSRENGATEAENPVSSASRNQTSILRKDMHTSSAAIAASMREFDTRAQNVDLAESQSASTLAESRLFSAEEAQSLYMSALGGIEQNPDPFDGLHADLAISQPRRQDHPLQTDPSGSVTSADVSVQARHAHVNDEQMSKQLFFCSLFSTDLPLPASEVRPSGRSEQRPESDLSHSSRYMPGSFSTSLGDAESTNTSTQFSQPGDRAVETSHVPVGINAENVELQADLVSSIMVRHMFLAIASLLQSPSTTQGRGGEDIGLNRHPHQNWSVDYAIQQLQLRLINPSSTQSVSGVSQEQTHADSITCVKALSINGNVCASERFPDLSVALGKLYVELAGLEVIRLGELESQSPHGSSARQVSSDDALIFNLKQRAGVPEINVVTSMAHFDVDLYELDERLASFGGLSSLLGAGSLVMTSNVAEVRSPHVSRSPYQRAVRFNVDQEDNEPGSVHLDSAQIKLNVRMRALSGRVSARGGNIICTTSAVKFVQRPGISGLQIDQMTIQGPKYPDAAGSRPSIEIGNLNVKILARPEESDLSRLLALLITPGSRSNRSEEILVDTLIRQRRQGTVARIGIGRILAHLDDIEDVQAIRLLGEDLSKLSNITQYFPKESRPGTLTLCSIEGLEANSSNLRDVGKFMVRAGCSNIAYIGSPFVFAYACKEATIHTADHQPLLCPLLRVSQAEDDMITARVLEGENAPSLRIKLTNVCMEYMPEMLSDFHAAISRPHNANGHVGDTGESPSDRPVSSGQLELQLDIILQDCGLGVSSRRNPARGLFSITRATLAGPLSVQAKVPFRLEITKLALWLTEGPYQGANSNSNSKLADATPITLKTIDELGDHGYVTVVWASSAVANVRVKQHPGIEKPTLDAQFHNELIVLETCADSTQTLSDLFSMLKPADPQQKMPQFQTEVAPFEDMMASFSGDAFDLQQMQSVDVDTDLHQSYDELASEEDYEDIAANVPPSDFDAHGKASDVCEELISGAMQPRSLPTEPVSNIGKWDSRVNRFIAAPQHEVNESPMSVHISKINFVWNLHDGYDWASTRNKISSAVRDAQAKTQSRMHHGEDSIDEQESNDSVIDDFLFNSIYIGVPTSKSSRDLAHDISMAVAHPTFEGANQVPPYIQPPSSSPVQAQKDLPSNLQLARSKRQKITFDLQGLSADIVQFQAGGENDLSVHVRVQSVDIFDHVPTSTWRKFLTYQEETGSREEVKPMLRLDMCTVRPVTTLPASELVLRVTVLPLRLHVDQDALDFLTRFFEFHDDSTPSRETSSPGAYLQRVEVLPVKMKLDYKPKKVDYVGLRSGRTKEFMNFFNLDAADIVLKHVVIYGCPSFARLHQNLEDIWMPDIKSNQLPYILSGLNGIRTIVNVGGGFRTLLTVPVEEYRKDGKLIRSISKGAESFLRITGGELTRFGARLAVGAQNAFQGAENQFSAGSTIGPVLAAGSSHASKESTPAAHSPFAEQPIGFWQGLRSAASSLERDLLATRDVIVAVSGEVRSSESAEDVARAVARHAPVLILRPVIGASKAISQTLLGATNSVDPINMRRMSDKYKRY